MIPVQIPLMNGRYETRWTSGADIGKVFYEDLSTTDQFLFDDIYYKSSDYTGLVNYLNKYDNQINVTRFWFLYFYLGCK